MMSRKPWSKDMDGRDQLMFLPIFTFVHVEYTPCSSKFAMRSPLLISTINHRDWLLQTLVNYRIKLKLAKITPQDESTNQPELQKLKMDFDLYNFRKQ